MSGHRLALVCLVCLAAPLQAAPGAPGEVAVSRPAAVADSAAVMAALAPMRGAAYLLPGIATGGQPDSSALAALSRLGFRTVLDLRAPGENRGFAEAEVSRAQGMAYESLPVTPEGLTDSTFTAFRAALRSQEAQPVLVHCASGNRVGAMLIPWLMLDRGWSEAGATELARRAGLRSEDLRLRALDYADRARGTPPADTTAGPPRRPSAH